MTNEQAIKTLKKLKSFHNGSYGTAIDEAIKALEQQFCEDCISRDAVKEMLSEEWTKYMPMDLDINLSFVMGKISELPSVTPKARWIPVSERLPEDHETVLIYLSSNQITIGIYRSHRLPFMDKPIGWGTDVPHDWSSDEVIAWMPLPEPYQPPKMMCEED